MYEKFYDFKFKPFDLLPDPRFLYLSKEHDLALTHLEYGITDNKGFIVLTGDVGTGKTTLINFFLKKIDMDVNTALIYNTNLDPTTFLEMVVSDFGVQIADSRRSTLYHSLYQFLLDEHIHGRRSVLIIDEAQNMPNETMEEVRMLSNFETEECYLLQIIMAGQPQLKKRLNDPELAQLTQRISVYYHLAPLEKSEIAPYIEHRLKVTGYPSPDSLFTSKAMEKVYEYTKGVPRLISSVCDTALVYGYADEIKTIDSDLIEKVIKNRGIDAGIQQEEKEEKRVSTDEQTYQISNLDERITRIEHRLSQLENMKNQHAFSKLIEWLKEAQEENLTLQKKHNGLLLRYKMMNMGKPQKEAQIENKDMAVVPLKKMSQP